MNAKRTSRKLKNVKSGIDLSIPGYNEIPGLFGSSVEYHVVVVTDLTCFKTTTLESADVVQFMIKKPYMAFDQLRKHLLGQFPGTVFPQLPQKSLSSVLGDVSIKDWANQLEKFLSFLAAEPNFIHLPYTLEFLGVKPTVAANFKPVKRKTQTAENSHLFAEGGDENETTEKRESSTDLFSLGNEEKNDEIEEAGLFDDIVTANQGASLFGDDDNEEIEELFGKSKKKTAPRLFEEQDLGTAVESGDNLLLIAGAEIKKEEKEDKSNNEDLFKIVDDEDDLDALLKLNDEEFEKSITKKKDTQEKKTEEQDESSPNAAIKPTLATKPKLPQKPKGKPTIPMKPGAKPNLAPKPTKSPKPTTHQPAAITKTEENASKKLNTEIKPTSDDSTEVNLDTTDILKYIEDNQSKEDNGLDLFS